MRRVVVTGLGAVTPLGSNIKSSWDNLLKCQSGIRTITLFDHSALPVHIAGEVPKADEPNGFNIDTYVSQKEQKKMDRFIHLGIGAAVQAVEDSGLVFDNEELKENTGVLIGSGIGGLPCIEKYSVILAQEGPRRISPFFIPASLINLVSGYISMQYGLHGPTRGVVDACATGANAIGDACRMIQFGDADVMIAGGTESAICGIGIGGFAAARALSTRCNDTPHEASRPWDKLRDGFVMGEGAGILVLEEYEHAKKRGARIYAELVGFGMSGDAYHVTAPHPEGKGARLAMQRALNNAKIDPTAIDYINAHGTSTPPGDAVEILAVKTLFKEHAYKLAMSSTKSSIGHLLGAAGSVEAVFSVLALQDNIMPATLNLHDPSEDCDINLVPLKPQERKLNYVMSNAFGFGGTNTSVIFTKLNA